MKKFKSVLNVTLGPYRNIHSPGFGHILWVVAAMLAYTRRHGIYLNLITNDWYYGDWTTYLVPFWDEQERLDVLTRGLPVESIDDTYGTGWGWEYPQIPEIGPLVPDCFKEIFKFNQDTQERIEKDSINFLDIDLAVHIRTNYEERQSPSLSQYEQKINELLQSQDIKKIFLMTDDKRAVDHMQLRYPQLTITTLCPSHYDGIGERIRSPEELYLLLKEVTIAQRAKYFVGWSSSNVTRILIAVPRDHRNCLLVEKHW